MKKRLKIILLLLIIGILSLKFISRPFANTDTIICRISNILNKNNKIDLKCTGINKSDIDIIWTPDLSTNILIIEGGKLKGKIGHEYGKNRFKIMITDSLEFNVGHFKYNNWHSHIYGIDILKDSNGFVISFMADGPDHGNFEQHFDLNGVRNGQVFGYFKNGIQSYKGYYQKGLMNGEFVHYFSNGQIQTTTDYVNDTIHGYITKYDESGNINEKTKYNKGEEIKENE